MNKIAPYMVHFLIPVFAASSALCIFLFLGYKFDFKIFLFFFVAISIWITLRWNAGGGKFIKNSINFIECETNEKGLNIFSKEGNRFIEWNHIIRVTFQNKSFHEYTSLSKKLGDFVITDNLNSTFELPPVIENRDLLIEEIVNKAGLQEKYQGLAGESASGYAYWERAEKNEDVRPINSVNLLKQSSSFDFLIVSILAIIMLIAIVLIFHYMQTGEWFAL